MEEIRLGREIHRLDNLMGRTIGQAKESLGLTATQGFVLGYLARHKDEPPMCLRDLETRFDLTHPTVSGIVSRLEAKGFVSLTTDEKDRRVKRIALLPAGENAHRKIAVAIDDAERRLASGFSQEESALFCGFLRRAISNMGGDCAQKEEKHG